MFRVISLGLPLRLLSGWPRKIPQSLQEAMMGILDINLFSPRRVVKASLAQDGLSTISGLCGAGDPSLPCTLAKCSTNRAPAFWGTRSYLFCSLSLPGTPRDLPVLIPLELLAWVIALVFSTGAVLSLWVLRMLSKSTTEKIVPAHSIFLKIKPSETVSLVCPGWLPSPILNDPRRSPSPVVN